jgi:2-keto-4-pentenoate hydratase/2-oxohepta-3-ene-1,7-dioic acid hydratase in catechol pathway
MKRTEKPHMGWWRAILVTVIGKTCRNVSEADALVTGLDPSILNIKARITGVEVQNCNSRDTIRDTAAYISYISQSVILEPGDILYAGTGRTQVDLSHGDIVEIEVEGI